MQLAFFVSTKFNKLIFIIQQDSRLSLNALLSMFLKLISKSSSSFPMQTQSMHFVQLSLYVTFLVTQDIWELIVNLLFVLWHVWSFMPHLGIFSSRTSLVIQHHKKLHGSLSNSSKWPRNYLPATATALPQTRTYLTKQKFQTLEFNLTNLIYSNLT